MLEELLVLLKMKRKSGSEQPVLEYALQKALSLGLEVDIQTLSRGSYNLIINPELANEFVIATHVDVVSEDPSLKINGDKVIAKGAADPLAQVAIILSLMEEINYVAFALFSDEEDWGTGSLAFAAKYRPKMALILEPTSLKIATSSYGAIGFETEVEFEPLHGSQAGKSRLEDLVKTTVPEGVNVLRLSCYGEEYTTIAKCKVEAELLLPPGSDVISAVKNLANSPRTRILYISPPMKSVKGKLFEALTKACSEVLGFCEEIVYPSWTDATNLQKFGAEVAIFGPGKPEFAHTAKESVSLEEMKAARKALLRVIELIQSASGCPSHLNS